MRTTTLPIFAPLLMSLVWLSVPELALSSEPAPQTQTQAKPATARQGLPSTYRGNDDEDEPGEGHEENLRRLGIIAYVLFLAIGVSIGSFLNVVIYRLPNGRAVIGNSKCPKCDQAIKFTDNIPIIGWLRLRGKCRTCATSISMRYPIIEAVVGGLFVVLLGFELLSGGENLAVRPPNQHVGALWIVWHPKWDLIGIYLFHCCLGSVLIAATMMQWDGHALPRRLFRFATLVGVIAPTFWRHLHPVSFIEPRLKTLTNDYRWSVPFDDPLTGWPMHFGVGLDGLLDSVVGFVIGFSVGWLLSKCLGRGAFAESPNTANAFGFSSLFGVTTTFLGWQSAAVLSIVVSVIAVVMAVVARATGEPRWSRRSTAGALTFAALFQVLAWRKLSTVGWAPDYTGWPLVRTASWWPGALEPYASLAIAVAIACLIALVRSLIGTPARPDSVQAD